MKQLLLGALLATSCGVDNAAQFDFTERIVVTAPRYYTLNCAPLSNPSKYLGYIGCTIPTRQISPLRYGCEPMPSYGEKSFPEGTDCISDFDTEEEFVPLSSFQWAQWYGNAPTWGWVRNNMGIKRDTNGKMQDTFAIRASF